MIPSRFQSDQCPRPGRGPNLREPTLEKPLYTTLLEISNLLEDYAPAWYSDALRHRVEAILQHEP